MAALLEPGNLFLLKEEHWSLFSATDRLWQEFSASPLAAGVKWLKLAGKKFDWSSLNVTVHLTGYFFFFLTGPQLSKHFLFLCSFPDVYVKCVKYIDRILGRFHLARQATKKLLYHCY